MQEPKKGFSAWVEEVAWGWYHGRAWCEEYPSQCEGCPVRIYPEAYMTNVRWCGCSDCLQGKGHEVPFACEDCIKQTPEEYSY